MNEIEFKHPWDVFEMYLSKCVDYFESYENMDYEQCTLRDQVNDILSHIRQRKYFHKISKKD